MDAAQQALDTLLVANDPKVMKIDGVPHITAPLGSSTATGPPLINDFDRLRAAVSVRTSIRATASGPGGTSYSPWSDWSYWSDWSEWANDTGDRWNRQQQQRPLRRRRAIHRCQRKRPLRPSSRLPDSNTTTCDTRHTMLTRPHQDRRRVPAGACKCRSAHRPLLPARVAMPACRPRRHRRR